MKIKLATLVTLCGLLARAAEQSGWRWCNDCSTLFFGANSSQGQCALTPGLSPALLTNAPSTNVVFRGTAVQERLRGTVVRYASANTLARVVITTARGEENSFAPPTQPYL